MPVVHAELVMGYVDDKLIQNQQSYLSKIIHLNQHHLKTQAPTEQKTEAIIFKKKNHNQNIMIILTGIIYHAIRVNHDGQIVKIRIN